MENRTIMAEDFENMMKLAEYGASRHTERRQVLFRIFISYMTLLVVISGLIMNNWKNEFIESGLFVWGVSLLLIAMFCFYWRWLIIFYKASDHDVRRRDFYLTKAQVICYYMSEELSQCYSDCKMFTLILVVTKAIKLVRSTYLERGDPILTQKLIRMLIRSALHHQVLSAILIFISILFVQPG